MDIERLEELKTEFEEERKYNDVRCMSTATEDDVLELIDEAIARQSVTSEEVQTVIKRFEKRNNKLKEVQENGDAGCVDIETWEKYQGFIEDNNLAITALQAYQPWIPVSERLPDGNVASVLIYTKEGGVAEGKYYPTIRAWKQFIWLVEDSSVTHWMPLPEPPKGD